MGTLAKNAALRFGDYLGGSAWRTLRVIAALRNELISTVSWITSISTTLFATFISGE
jgi:hypothetical protein